MAGALHALVVVTGVIAYVVVTVAGQDGNPVLAAVLGYAGGGVVQAKAGVGRS